MPNYNCASYVGEAISSIQTQDFNNWELIVIDDCSTDTSFEIISALSGSDSRILLLKNSNRKGPGASRNVGLKNSRGRFIAFLDSDDYWPNNRLSLQMAIMKNNKLAISFGDYTRFLIKDTILSIRVKAIHNSVSFRKLLGNPMFSIITLMIDKKEISTIPKFEESIYRAEDYLFHLDLLTIHPIAYRIPKILAYYRFVPLSNSSRGCMREMWWIFKNKLELGFLMSSWYFLVYLFNALKRRLFGKS